MLPLFVLAIPFLFRDLLPISQNFLVKLEFQPQLELYEKFVAKSLYVFENENEISIILISFKTVTLQSISCDQVKPVKHLLTENIF